MTRARDQQRASAPILARAMDALFVDPDTGAPVRNTLDRISILIGAIQGVVLVTAILAIALGLGGGR